MAERESDITITTDTAYLALMGELWCVYCEDLGENWPRYIGTARYSTLVKYAYIRQQFLPYQHIYHLNIQIISYLSVPCNI